MSEAIVNPKKDYVIKEQDERKSKKINFRRILLVIKKDESSKIYESGESHQILRLHS
jgi:hypothetical protein